MRKILTEAAIEAIVKAVKSPSLDGPVTWRRIGEIAAEICKRPLTRQALSYCPAIREAFESRQTMQRGGVSTTPLSRAMQTIADLRAEIVERDAILRLYDERLILHLKRAREHGLTQEMLEAPLPKIIRTPSRIPRHARAKNRRRRAA